MRKCYSENDELTACVCYLSDAQAAESHRSQEGVCALVGHRKWSVVYISQSQHQSIVEQEEANIRHMLKGPNNTGEKNKTEVWKISFYKTTVLHLVLQNMYFPVQQ